VADGDLATGWPPPEGAHGPVAQVVVDLGAVYALGRLVWWPTTAPEATLRIDLATSADGARWEPVGSLPGRRPAFVAGGRPFFRPRDGWLEARFPPRRVRYLRFARPDPDPAPWGIAEVLAYEDAGPAPAADVGLDPAGLAGRLQARGLTRLLADPGISARVALATGGGIRTLTANAFLDSHGRYLPPARLAEPVRLGPTDALLVPDEDAADLGDRLHADGLAFREEPAGRHRLLYGLTPVASTTKCRPTTWAVTRVARGAEGSGSRYTLEATLREAGRLVGLRLDHAAGLARALPLPVVTASADGRRWRPLTGIRRLAEWGWAGRTLFKFSGPSEELVLPPTPARQVRVDGWLPDGGGAVTNVCARAA
jgi:hypothetical protein